MYCSLNDQVKKRSILLGQRRRRPVCRMLKVVILGCQADRESLSAVDGAIRCCRSAGTQFRQVYGGAMSCRHLPWCRLWTCHASQCRSYDECLSAHGWTCECQIRLAPPHSLRAVACLTTPSLPQRADSCSSQPDWWRRHAPMSLLRRNRASDELDEAVVAGKTLGTDSSDVFVQP